MLSDVGCEMDLGAVPGDGIAAHRQLFSESHSRYLLATSPDATDKTVSMLRSRGVPYGVIGTFSGREISFPARSGSFGLRVDKARNLWRESLGNLIGRG
jgi:phosphoribosylformylglycinamidine synthase